MERKKKRYDKGRNDRYIVFFTRNEMEGCWGRMSSLKIMKQSECKFLVLTTKCEKDLILDYIEIFSLNG